MTGRIHPTSTNIRSRRSARRTLTLQLTAAIAACGGADALAQTPPSERIVKNPFEAFLGRREPDGDISVMSPRAARREAPGEKFLNFRIAYTESKIYNPRTQKYDRVKLRSYQDANKPANLRNQDGAPPPFVAPTIRVRPGDTVRISLDNQLPDEGACVPADPNIPHCFNSTNLHSHGLWVSPTGNSDNVLITIRPKVQFQYEYNISTEHPAGTFWYHPHLHGSTAVQVASGMAGALIVTGARKPTPERNGDIDTILINADDGSAFEDRVVLLQQIPYACRETSGPNKGQIKKNPDGTWACDANPSDTSEAAIGQIEKFDVLDRTAWPPSGRYTTINGETFPTFAGARVGRPERWRIIHAGVRETVKVQFRKLKPSITDPEWNAALDSMMSERWLESNCVGAPLTQFAFASDGLTRRKIVERDVSVLQPGYREDQLIVFPEAGDYCIIDDAAQDSDASVTNAVESRKLLGRIRVTGRGVNNDVRETLTTALVAAAESFLPNDVKEKVKTDLNNGLLLTSFVPHPDVKTTNLGEQTLSFNIEGGKFMINDKPYDPNRIDRSLVLGGADRWTLTSKVASHPFHIHVNPFQIESISKDGKEIDDSTGDGDPQYANLKGVWRDTLFIKNGYTVKLLTRYERYIGQFVLHCHILDHEDQGMMQNVSIGIPDGSGGVVTPEHSPHGITP